MGPSGAGSEYQVFLYAYIFLWHSLNYLKNISVLSPPLNKETTLLDFLTGMHGDSVHASGKVALPDNDELYYCPIILLYC